MNNSRQIVISGSIAVDRIMSFMGTYSEYINPEMLHRLSVSIFLDEVKDVYGGVGGNIAYSLALIGESPMLLGSVGRDGLIYMEHLAKQGVNITHVYESELPTATFNVITDKDQNQVGGFYPGAMSDSGAITLEPWYNSVDAFIVLSPQDPEAMRRQVEECKKWKLRLFYDISQQVSNTEGKDMKAGINAAEILILNEYELSVLSNKTKVSMHKIKELVPVVVTTLGKHGSVIEGKSVDKPIKIDIAPPISVKDPTGAGDAFRAGFLYGYIRDWPLKICGQLGAVSSAYAIETVGPQNHLFTPAEFFKRYDLIFKGK